MDYVSEGDKSAYNSAVQFMFELAGIRRQLHTSRWEKNIELRYDVLVSYYLALSSRMKEKLQNKHDQYFEDVTSALNDYHSAIDRKLNTAPRAIFRLLDLWEKELRKDENALGLLVPSKDSPEHALGGMHY